MRILCRNVKGLGGKGRRRQLKERVDINRVDIICLQETMKENFTIAELRGLASGQSFSSNWAASTGHSGGTLLGDKQGDIDATDINEGKYYLSISIENKKDKFKWEIVNVYGPVQTGKKLSFYRNYTRKSRGVENPLWCVEISIC
jgi:exonuclease III